MPIALLLAPVTAALTATAAALRPWVEIVALETTVVERARSAFLLHWFGRGLPFAGRSLRAHLVNLGELDARYGVAQRSAPLTRGGPTLAAQAGGFAGMLAGMLLSPGGAYTAIRLVARLQGVSLRTVLTAVGIGVLPVLLAAAAVWAPRALLLLGGGLTAGAAGYGVAAALGDRRELRGLVELLASAARFAVGGAQLVDQLRGDRAAVRNPLLRGLLELGDRLAPLFGQLLGAVALLVVRIGPVLPSAAGMLAGIARLGAAAGDVLADVGAGLRAGLESLAPGGAASVTGVVDRAAAVARRGLVTLRTAAAAQLDALAAAFEAVQAARAATATRFGDAAGTFVVSLFTGHPTLKVVEALRTQLRIAGTATPVPDPTPSTRLADFHPPPLPDVRDFPALPALPDAAALQRRLAAQRETPLRPLTWAQLEQLAEQLRGSGEVPPPVPPGTVALGAVLYAGGRESILAPERAAAGAPPEALLASQAGLARYREAMSVVVGRILPADRRIDAVTSLGALLDTIDTQLYGAAPVAPGEPAPLPVLEVAPEDLRADVHALRLRVPAAAGGAVDRFEDQLVARLRAALAGVGR